MSGKTLDKIVTVVYYAVAGGVGAKFGLLGGLLIIVFVGASDLRHEMDRTKRVSEEIKLLLLSELDKELKDAIKEEK